MIIFRGLGNIMYTFVVTSAEKKYKIDISKGVRAWEIVRIKGQ